MRTAFLQRFPFAQTMLLLGKMDVYAVYKLDQIPYASVLLELYVEWLVGEQLVLRQFCRVCEDMLVFTNMLIIILDR